MDTERHILAWIISVPCVAFWIFCAVINPVLFVRREFLKRPKAPSVIPVIGGIVGWFGMSIIPYALLNDWNWIAVLLDFGTVPWIVYILGKVGVERIRMRT